MTISEQNINMNWTSMNIYNFVDQLNDEIHENWYSTHIDETTVVQTGSWMTDSVLKIVN